MDKDKLVNKFKELTAKYDLLWTKEIHSKLVERSKIKGFLTTEEIDKTFLLLETMLDDLKNDIKGLDKLTK